MGREEEIRRGRTKAKSHLRDLLNSVHSAECTLHTTKGKRQTLVYLLWFLIYVFMRFLCVRMCVSLCLCVLLVLLSLTPFKYLYLLYFLVCFHFILFYFSRCLFSTKREQESVWILGGEDM